VRVRGSVHILQFDKKQVTSKNLTCSAKQLDAEDGRAITEERSEP
jgi:hypothetical protein